MAKASGRVLLDDEPLRFGTITLQPTSGQPAVGDIGSDGTFTLSTYAPMDGAALGKHRVKVTAYSSQDPASDKSEQAGDNLGELLVPQMYASATTSGIEVEVVEGANEFEIRMTTPVIVEAADEEVDGIEAEGDAPAAGVMNEETEGGATNPTPSPGDAAGEPADPNDPSNTLDE
ncbi:hypothetical protein [Aeoliella sp. SH292]|uniref:hypothetical protein n=1 Tax=Aeoliella sp. SH292 TaxID=3454464 RepID=UPI003F9E2E73